tara:strand:+ start:1571 stop:2266 length:696 start_codon:yes stop_codon:yes gene_type:complete
VDKKEPLSFHLRELENKMRSVLLLLIGSIIGFTIFSLEIMNSILEISNMEKENMAIYTPTEMLITRLKLGVILAIATTLPLMAIKLYQFTKPGLKEKEKKWIIFMIPISLIAFFTGAAIGYTIVLPEIIDFVIEEESRISISGFYDFSFFVIFGLGFVLQIPFIVFGNRIFNIWKKEEIEQKKNYIYIAIFGITFLISPEKSLIIQFLIGLLLIFVFKISLKMDNFIKCKM